jgi:small GTP-binding protein
VANNKSSADEQKRQKLIKDLAKSAVRKSTRPKNIRELGISALKNLPANITMVQNFMKAVNWKEAQEEVLHELHDTVVIVGLPNSGKSTLFNTIKGEQLSPVSAQAGTTKELVSTNFGPFTLIDTPGHLPEIMESGMQQASVIVFLIDATRGLTKQDRELYETIQKMKKPTIIAVNKIDELKGGESGDQIATEIAVMLGVAGVIPISARTGKNVADELIPAMIDASRNIAVRRRSALSVTRRWSAWQLAWSRFHLSIFRFCWGRRFASSCGWPRCMVSH